MNKALFFAMGFSFGEITPGIAKPVFFSSSGLNFRNSEPNFVRAIPIGSLKEACDF